MAQIFLKRRLGDMKMLANNPETYFDAYPDPDNLNNWYFLLTSFKDCDYEGGYYLGRIVLDDGYPFKAGNIQMLTPSGRFSINKNICVTATAYHQSEYTPSWNIKSLIIAFQSIMTSDNSEDHGLSHIRLENTSHAERKNCAKNSVNYNKSHHFDIITKFERFIDKNGDPLPQVIMPEKKKPNNKTENNTTENNTPENNKTENSTENNKTENSTENKTENSTENSTKTNTTENNNNETSVNSNNSRNSVKHNSNETVVQNKINSVLNETTKINKMNSALNETTNINETGEENKIEDETKKKNGNNSKVRKSKKEIQDTTNNKNSKTRKSKKEIQDTTNNEADTSKTDDTINEKPKRKYTRKSNNDTTKTSKPKKKSNFLGI